MSEASRTTNHDTIRAWAEARNGHPARVGETTDGGILRVDFDPPEASLEPISWSEFFRIFEDRKLAFLCQEKTEGGQTSRFNKLVHRQAE